MWAKEDSDKFDPTAKLVLFGGVVDASSAYELLWTQVTWVWSGVGLSDTWYVLFIEHTRYNSLVTRVAGGGCLTLMRALFVALSSDITAPARFSMSNRRAVTFLRTHRTGARFFPAPKPGMKHV